jgi:hypothetical protein
MLNEISIASQHDYSLRPVLMPVWAIATALGMLIGGFLFGLLTIPISWLASVAMILIQVDRAAGCPP